MIAITIGYRSTSIGAAFEVLYAGRDATAADAASLTPPPGILRTELFKNPVVVRRRSFPENIAAEEEAKPAKPSKPKADPATAEA